CIETASSGVYQKEALVNVSQTRLKKYFIQNEDGYKISPTLRQQIVFATHDILQDAPFTKLNLVSCRNLLIYWKPSAKKKALSLFNFSLRESGTLFLGPSESTTELESAYQAINEKWRLYRKIAPVRFSQVEMSINSSTKMMKRLSDPPAPVSVKEKELTAAYDCLLGDYMPTGVLIDEAYQVLHIFGDAAGLLQQKKGRPTTDLIQLLPSSFQVAVTNGLKRLKIELKPVVYTGLECESGGKTESYRITIKPVSTTYSPKYLVTFEVFDAERELADPAQLGSTADSAAKELLKSMGEELRETRESLHDSILNLKSTNEEMQSTNEELIASNEELQSTNEELHSVNEELYTVNSEHQRKITELTQLTDDMDNLLDSIQVDTIYLDRELRVRKFTLGIAKTFKLLPQDVGREFGSFNHELQYENLTEKIESILKTERSTDEEVQDTSGNWYLMRLLPYNSLGHIDGVLLTLIDISRIKQTEQQLEELSEIVQASEDAIFRVSMDGMIRTWNRGAVHLFMQEPENAIGQSIEVLNLDKKSQDAISHALQQITNGEKYEHVELKASRRDGEEFDVQSTISPIHSSAGSLDGASIILRDVTAQKKAEQQIREEVRRRDHFLAVLSHELRNPTAAIMNASAILGKKEATAETHQQANGIITRHAQQLAKMMDDLLDVARVTHNKVRLDMRPTDLNETVQQVLESIEHRTQDKNQVLALEIANGLAIRIADKTRIIQAQTNLLVNAFKYTPENGHIRFAIWEENEDVVFEVSDDGDGMSKELLPKIFDVFVQADQQLDRTAGGMGLGLPIVRMIAEAHGGTVTAHSDGVGCGSAFTMRLPLVAAEPKAPKVVPADNMVNSNHIFGQRVLLIEDNDGAREMLAGYLELDNFNVRTAINGSEGIVTFQEFQPEICIVDIGLPDLNGFEVARAIKSSDYQPDLLIALTGYGQMEDRHKAIEAGFDLHLVKPIQPEELIATISEKHSALTEDL
ncbi:PAS domain-containing protein, partial [bacterium]|nr:PAS domain-containing protein [bacterium]